MSEKRKIFLNSLSVITQKLIQGAATIVLTAIIARTLGAEALGQYLLGISFFYIFVDIGSQGFKTLFTREIAKNPQSTPLYLFNGLVLQVFFCIITYLALLIVIFLLPYSATTSMVCYIIGLAVIPFGLSNITESILQAQERMYLVTLSTTPIYLLRLMMIIFVINQGYGINDIGIIFVISELVIFIIEWLIITRDTKPNWHFDKDFIWQNILSARTFIAIESIGILAGRMDVLLISLLGNEVLIGVYGAIKQLLQPFFIVSRSVGLAVFPQFSKTALLVENKQKEVTENIIHILLFMSLPFYISISFLGQDILLLIYKSKDFEGLGLIFNLVAISVITSSFATTFGYLLTANGYEKVQLISSLLTTTIAGILGVLLISEYKLMGAAYMIVGRTLTSFATLAIPVYTRLFAIDLWKILNLPLLITGVLSMVLYTMKMLNFNLILMIIIDILTYVILVGAIATYSLGGIGGVKQKLRHKFKG